MQRMYGGFVRFALQGGIICDEVEPTCSRLCHEYQLAIGKTFRVESRLGITATARVLAARDDISRRERHNQRCESVRIERFLRSPSRGTCRVSRGAADHS